MWRDQVPHQSCWLKRLHRLSCPQGIEFGERRGDGVAHAGIAAERAGPSAERLAPALLEVHSIFGNLGSDPRMRNAVTEALTKLYALGARQTVQTFQPA